jgi:hypothetical protein
LFPYFLSSISFSVLSCYLSIFLSSFVYFVYLFTSLQQATFSLARSRGTGAGRSFVMAGREPSCLLLTVHYNTVFIMIGVARQGLRTLRLRLRFMEDLLTEATELRPSNRHVSNQYICMDRIALSSQSLTTMAASNARRRVAAVTLLLFGKTRIQISARKPEPERLFHDFP